MEYLTLFLVGVVSGLTLVLLLLASMKLNKVQIAKLRTDKKFLVIFTVTTAVLMGLFVSGMVYICAHISL